MQFKTMEEKQKALDEVVTDAPPGVDIDDFTAKTEATIDEIMNAPVEEDGEPPVETPAEPQHAPPAEPQSKVELPPQPPAEPKVDPVKNEMDEMEVLRRNNEYLQQQKRSLERNNEQKMKELEKQIEELKSQGSKTTVTEEKNDTDLEMDRVRSEINNLETEMNKAEEDFDTEASIKLLKKQNQLTLKLSSLQDQKHKDFMARQNAALEKLKKEKEMERRQIEDENAENKLNKTIEKFREEFDELQGDQTFNEMKVDFSRFALEIGSIYYNIPVSDVMTKDAEMAMQVYMQNPGQFSYALQTRGIVEPPSLKTYTKLSEIDALRQGYVFDKLTGDWNQLKDAFGEPVKFPNHKAAYLYLQQENGTYGETILNKQKSTQKNMMHAMTRREPIELTAEQQRSDNIDTMTEARATELIEKYDMDTIALRARKNPKDPLFQEYNKALEKLGYATIDAEDL